MTALIQNRKRRARVTLSFHVYPNETVQLKSGQVIGFLDGLDDLRKVDAWDQSFLIKTAISEYIAKHHPGNPGLPLNHWTKGEPLSVAAEEKLSQKHHEKASVDYGSMSLDELRALAKKRFLSDRERSFINFFIRQKEAHLK
mgnify:CR=1 FL=1